MVACSSSLFLQPVVEKKLPTPRPPLMLAEGSLKKKVAALKKFATMPPLPTALPLDFLNVGGLDLYSPYIHGIYTKKHQKTPKNTKKHQKTPFLLKKSTFL